MLGQTGEGGEVDHFEESAATGSQAARSGQFRGHHVTHLKGHTAEREHGARFTRSLRLDDLV
jgi:hypothetical protein